MSKLNEFYPKLINLDRKTVHLSVLLWEFMETTEIDLLLKMENAVKAQKDMINELLEETDQHQEEQKRVNMALDLLR